MTHFLPTPVPLRTSKPAWHRSLAAALAIACLPLPALAAVPASTLQHRAVHDHPSVAYQWLEILLEAAGRDVDRNKPRPTILSRAMALVVTAMFDAWAAYDDKAVGTRLGAQLRRPVGERTLVHKQKALGHAAWRLLVDLYPEDKPWLDAQLRKMGGNPAADTQDPAQPEGVANLAAAALIRYRHHDGANQLGDEPGSDGKPYSDSTYYRPTNTPEHIVDGTTWLPIPFEDRKGGTVLPGFLTPHWYRVKPFALERAEQFRPPPPPRYGSEQLRKEVDECIAANAHLTLEQKAIVEFMRDGPRSTGQSGHWLQLAEDVSRRDSQGLDADVKLFFAVGNVVFDAFIASWEAKRYYDTSRPYWWVRLLHKGEQIRGWAGPGQGVTTLPAEQWRPYSPATFVTPPFPGYTSGHATVSGAAAKLLELFTGSDRFGSTSPRMAGALTEPGVTPAQMQAQDGKPDAKAPATHDVVLSMPTFSATAEMAALSRMWGGYHIRSDNEAGLVLGRAVATWSWPKYQAYFNGTAAPVALVTDSTP
jgi:hypothetical protein